jgi:hypothetical protein
MVGLISRLVSSDVQREDYQTAYAACRKTWKGQRLLQVG